MKSLSDRTVFKSHMGGASLQGLQMTSSAMETGGMLR